ncbi:hypothetical protein GALL_398880 [mine drainage metagenome]|uniref:Uncharacterized protein n=1 Tax=mine drainage metagenome TaxID=410659 RepID=A0A1J5Q4W6_9ZZZZ
MSTPNRLRVAIATPLTDELRALLTGLEPRLDIVCDQTLLPPMRWPRRRNVSGPTGGR